MCRIAGRLRSRVVRRDGVTVEIPALKFRESNNTQLAWDWTVSGGQFCWGGILLKCNGGVQSLPHRGW